MDAFASGCCHSHCVCVQVIDLKKLPLYLERLQTRHVRGKTILRIEWTAVASTSIQQRNRDFDPPRTPSPPPPPRAPKPAEGASNGAQDGARGEEEEEDEGEGEAGSVPRAALEDAHGGSVHSGTGVDEGGFDAGGEGGYDEGEGEEGEE